MNIKISHFQIRLQLCCFSRNNSYIQGTSTGSSSTWSRSPTAPWPSPRASPAFPTTWTPPLCGAGTERSISPRATTSGSLTGTANRLSSEFYSILNGWEPGSLYSEHTFTHPISFSGPMRSRVCSYF